MEWADVVDLIRREGGPRKSRAVRGLYEMAIADGRRVLASFQRQLGDEVILELTHALVAEKLQEIVDANSPFALFKTALRRRAISWLRRGDAVVAERPDEALDAGASSTGATPGLEASAQADERQFVFDAQAALNSLSERDRQIAVAVGLGEDREAIARAFNTSRANVDQIVSRLRKRLDGGGS